MTQTKEKVEVLDAAVQWGDGYENWPDLTFLLDRQPVWETYEKRPDPLGHIYYSEDDEFVWFFVWAGRPDDGFGGYRRTIKLTDGTEEEVVGGWHVGGDVAERAGFSSCLDVTIRTDYLKVRGEDVLAGGTACFLTEERFTLEVERLLPDVELCRDSRNGILTVKWRGQPSKEEFMVAEHARRDSVRDDLKARYPGGSYFTRDDWYDQATDAERAELKCRPYSALGPVS